MLCGCVAHCEKQANPHTAKPTKPEQTKPAIPITPTPVQKATFELKWWISTMLIDKFGHFLQSTAICRYFPIKFHLLKSDREKAQSHLSFHFTTQ